MTEISHRFQIKYILSKICLPIKVAVGDVVITAVQSVTGTLWSFNQSKTAVGFGPFFIGIVLVRNSLGPSCLLPAVDSKHNSKKKKKERNLVPFIMFMFAAV